MNTKWSETEKSFIRENAHRLKDIEIADELTISSGRPVTLQSVRKMRQKLGIKKLSGRGVCGVITIGGNGTENETVPAAESHRYQLVDS
jgi:hypothetical protein